MPYFHECESCGEHISFEWLDAVPLDRVCWDCGLRGCTRCMPQPEPLCERCERDRNEIKDREP